VWRGRERLKISSFSLKLFAIRPRSCVPSSNILALGDTLSATAELKGVPEFHPIERPETALALMVDAVRDYAIFMLDPNGYVQTWNVGAQRIKGYSAEEIIGQHFSRFYRPEDQEIPKHALEIALRDGRFEHQGWRL